MTTTGSPAPYGVGATPTSTAAAADGSASTTLDKNAFLHLLVAQLKYQNPMSPTDGSQYMAQMAQFATVEQLTNISKEQADAASWQLALAGEGMVGRQVEGTDVNGAKHSGVVTGIQLTGGTPVLNLQDGSTLPVTDVTSVTAAGAPPAGSPPPAGTSSAGGA